MLLLSNRALQYADGKPRPRCRGVLHALFTICAVFGAAFCLSWPTTTLSTLSTTNTTPPHLQLALFLLCKAATTGASAWFHCYPYTTSIDVTVAFIRDLIFVPMSPIGTSMLVINFLSSIDIFVVFVQGSCFVINYYAVHYQMKDHVGLDTPTGRSDTYRFVPILVAATVSNYLILSRCSMDLFLLGGLFFAAIGAGLASKVTDAHLTNLSNPKKYPWHVNQWWGMHEDMHLLMVLSDLCFVGLGITRAMH